MFALQTLHGIFEAPSRCLDMGLPTQNSEKNEGGRGEFETTDFKLALRVGAGNVGRKGVSPFVKGEKKKRCGK